MFWFFKSSIVVCVFIGVMFIGCMKNEPNVPTQDELEPAKQEEQPPKTVQPKPKPAQKPQENTPMNPLKFNYQDIAPDKAQVSDYTGVITLYHANGKLAWEISFLKGRQEGATKWYYDNGKLRAQMHFVRGNANGEAKSYYKSGVLREEGFYENDHPIGESKLYSPKGKLQYTVYYQNGKEVNRTSHIK